MVDDRAPVRRGSAHFSGHGVRLWHVFRDEALLDCHAGLRILLRSRSNVVRPYICRLMVLIQFTVPSTAPGAVVESEAGGDGVEVGA